MSDVNILVVEDDGERVDGILVMYVLALEGLVVVTGLDGGYSLISEKLGDDTGLLDILLVTGDSRECRETCNEGAVPLVLSLLILGVGEYAVVGVHVSEQRKLVEVGHEEHRTALGEDVGELLAGVYGLVLEVDGGGCSLELHVLVHNVKVTLAAEGELHVAVLVNLSSLIAHGDGAHDQGEAMSLSDRIAVINRGKVEQLDGPAKIYEAPASRFVASFIGDTNFFSGTIVAVEGDYCTIEVDGFPAIKAYNDKNLAVGQCVDLSVRPEKIRVTLEPPPPEKGAGINIFPAKVQDIVYQGVYTKYWIKRGLSPRFPYRYNCLPNYVRNCVYSIAENIISQNRRQCNSKVCGFRNL